RARAHAIDWALALIFPGVALAAGLLGGLVLHDHHSPGGQLWISFGAALAALLPAAILATRWRDRDFVVGGLRPGRAAQARVSERDGEIEAVAEISNSLARARTPEAAAAPLVRLVTDLLTVGFAGVATLDDDGATATGVYAELGGDSASWWREINVDLRSEP